MLKFLLALGVAAFVAAEDAVGSDDYSLPESFTFVTINEGESCPDGYREPNTAECMAIGCSGAGVTDTDNENQWWGESDDGVDEEESGCYNWQFTEDGEFESGFESMLLGDAGTAFSCKIPEGEGACYCVPAATVLAEADEATCEYEEEDEGYNIYEHLIMFLEEFIPEANAVHVSRVIMTAAGQCRNFRGCHPDHEETTDEIAVAVGMEGLEAFDFETHREAGNVGDLFKLASVVNLLGANGADTTAIANIAVAANEACLDFCGTPTFEEAMDFDYKVIQAGETCGDGYVEANAAQCEAFAGAGDFAFESIPDHDHAQWKESGCYFWGEDDLIEYLPSPVAYECGAQCFCVSTGGGGDDSETDGGDDDSAVSVVAGLATVAGLAAALF